MHQKINEKKSELSAIIKREEIKDFNENSNSHKSLDGSAPELYSSDIFSKLNFDDLKKAHTETVIPVTEKELHNRPAFSSAENLKQYRNSQKIAPSTKDDAERYFDNKNTTENDVNTRLAYRLAMQDEQMEKANNKWWKNLKLLE